MKVPSKVEKAYEKARIARSHAHAPYSKFRVGAALYSGGKTVTGCNVENASYGGTICAERSAVVSAVASMGKIAPEFLVIVTGEPQATVPCGLCLQVLAEFCTDEMPVYLGNDKQILEMRKLSDFLPRPFRVFKAGK